MRLGDVWHRAAVAIATAALVVAGCAATPLPKMDDYRSNAIGQSLWHFRKPMYWVVGVPTFTQPVRIRFIELRSARGSTPFDPPEAYLLVYYASLYYNGAKLTYGLDPTVLAGSHRQALDSIPIRKLDNQLSIVIPVNVNQPGCHEAQIVFHVTTGDGQDRVYPARWYVTLDTGISKVEGNNGCAGPRPTPLPAPSATRST
jgi:hypothetical protein